ncbi:hypothetical protein K8R33_02285 [archaeon]|nr:hypothetical protein [archaeon]
MKLTEIILSLIEQYPSVEVRKMWLNMESGKQGKVEDIRTSFRTWTTNLIYVVANEGIVELVPREFQEYLAEQLNKYDKAITDLAIDKNCPLNIRSKLQTHGYTLILPNRDSTRSLTKGFHELAWADTLHKGVYVTNLTPQLQSLCIRGGFHEGERKKIKALKLVAHKKDIEEVQIHFGSSIREVCFCRNDHVDSTPYTRKDVLAYWNDTE